MTTPHDYARTHAGRFKQEMIDLLAIPSVSTQPEHNADVERAAEWIAANMRRIGMTTVEIHPTAWHPVVYGEWLGAGPNAPTVLVYGHYDVQPAEMADGWHSNPFIPTERELSTRARSTHAARLTAKVMSWRK